VSSEQKTRRLRGRARALAIVSLLVVGAIAACAPGTGDVLEVKGGADGPQVESLEARPDASHAPGGGDEVVIHGKNFPAQNCVVRFGHRKQEDVTVVSPTEIHCKTPEHLPAGETLAVAVEKTDEAGEEVVARGVLADAWRVAGLSSRNVVLMGCALGVFALLGGQLFVVLACVTLLGIYVKGQGEAGFGFLTQTGADGHLAPGAAANLFLPWCGKTAESPLFIAIPLFTFAGTIMAESKTPERLVDLTRAFLGWLPGGVAFVALLASSIFTAFTGASGVTIIALGGLLYPVLKREGYPDRFSLGLLTTCGSLGLLMTPSLPVYIYAIIAKIDADRLFTAALVPFLVLIFLLAFVSFLQAIRHKIPRQSFSMGELRRTFRIAVWELPLIPLVIGGIKFGWFTAAEASAVTAAYALVAQLFVYRDIKWRDMPRVVKTSMVLVGAILLILGMALGFMDWLTDAQVPQKILGLMESYVHDKFAFLLMLNAFLLIVGCFMEGYSATLVVVPLVAPIAKNYGVDPYHLGVIFLLNLEIAYSLPPVGFNLFLAALRFGKPVVSLYKAAFDFVLVMLIALLAVTYVPKLALGLFATPGVRVETPGPIDATLGEDKPVRVAVTLGNVETTEAKSLAMQAHAALEKAETANGAKYEDLARRLKAVQDKLENASPADRSQLGVERSEIRAKMAPLVGAAEAAQEADRLVTDLDALAQSVEWRSRLEPKFSAKGLGFSTQELTKPGEHEITVTAVDGHGHVAQEKLVVRIAPSK
jgi:tripartite ATP-independent transporter DctM subunit